MTLKVELSGGPGDGQRITVVAESAVGWPPEAIYVPLFGDPTPIAGELVGKYRIVANGYAIYHPARRTAADGRVVYQYARP